MEKGNNDTCVGYFIYINLQTHPESDGVNFIYSWGKLKNLSEVRKAQTWTWICLLFRYTTPSCFLSLEYTILTPCSVHSPLLFSNANTLFPPSWLPKLAFTQKKIPTTSLLDRKTHNLFGDFCYKTFNVNLQYNVNFYEKTLKYTRSLQSIIT